MNYLIGITLEFFVILGAAYLLHIAPDHTIYSSLAFSFYGVFSFMFGYFIGRKD